MSIPMYTRDGGQEWHLVPVPKGASLGSFGQFSQSESGVSAVFGPAKPATPAGNPSEVYVMSTADGATTWTPGSLTCPARGPCVTWGPVTNGNNCMGTILQPMLMSRDAGRSWGAIGTVDVCSVNQIAALSDARLLLMENGASPPGVLGETGLVRLSTDEGLHWSGVSLPALPSGDHPRHNGLRMLPNGSLLDLVSPSGSSTVRLALLSPNASSW